MGRETFGTVPENAFRVPIIREKSANASRGNTEQMRGPDLYQGLVELGRSIHSAGAPVVERVLQRLSRERQREIVAVGETDPGKLDMAAIEHLESGVDQALEGHEAMRVDEAALDGRTVGRGVIIAELENAAND
mgnify:CR=1 FL=1